MWTSLTGRTLVYSIDASERYVCRKDVHVYPGYPLHAVLELDDDVDVDFVDRQDLGLLNCCLRKVLVSSVLVCCWAVAHCIAAGMAGFGSPALVVRKGILLQCVHQCQQCLLSLLKTIAHTSVTGRVIKAWQHCLPPLILFACPELHCLLWLCRW